MVYFKEITRGFMSENITSELIYEVLKQIQKRLDRHEGLLKGIQMGQVKIREDVHELRGDRLRIERYIAEVENRLERVERRLEITDA